MISLIVVRNPLQPHLKEAMLLAHRSGKSLQEYLIDNGFGDNYGAAVNGHVVENMSSPLDDGDCVVVMPILGSGFKDILRLVAGIMLGAYVGSIMGGTESLFGKGLGKYLAAGAVMYLGGRVINALLPYDQAKIPTNEQSPNYGWDTGQIITQQGGVVGKTYGTVRIQSPTLLSYYVSVVNDKQYLNMLLCGGEGPVDNITDITIEDNPVTNYKDVVVEIRLGTNDQAVISNFDFTPNTQSLAYELSTADWTIHQTDGNAGEGLELTMEFPQGLYYLNDKGKLQNATVRVAAEYRKVGDVNWLPLQGTGGTTVTAGANQGSGTVTGITAGNDAVNEIWTLTCTSLIKNGYEGEQYYSPQFSVTGSVSGVATAVNAQQKYSNGKIGFTIIEGAQNFAIGDTFTISFVPGDYGFTAAKNTAIRRTLRKDNIPAGQYEVRCKCTYKSGTDTTRYGTKVVWSELKHILYDDFERPNKVLVSIKALATDQLSGNMPSIKWTQRRGTVWVWNPYNSQYEAKRADSPAWASYDVYHQCSKLRNINTGLDEYVVEGVPASRMVYDEFAAAPDDEIVDGDKRFYFDYHFDTAQTIWDASRVASLCGRGVVMPRGVKIGYQIDKPRTPVQLFSMGNTTLKSFKGKFIGKKDRASVVEIEFTNRDKKYETDTLPVYGAGYDTSTTVDNPAKITRRGITRYKHAYREGQYAVRQNERIGRALDISADVDGIVCQTGDVVLVQHDVPRWGAAGGRIVSASGVTVVLDRTVTMTPGETYRLNLRVSETDELIERIVVNTGNTTDTLTLTEALPAESAKYDVYAFGKPPAKPFTVTGMTRSGDQQVKLSLAEYDEAVYTDEAVPEIDYSELSTAAVEVTGLAVSQETYHNKDSTVISVMHASWKPPARSVKAYRVLYRRQAESEWAVWSGVVTDSGADITGVATLETYLVKVCTVNGIGIVSPGVTSDQILITGKDNPPSNIASLTATIDQSDRTKITLNWSEVDDIDLRGYRLMEGNTVLTPTPISDTRYVFTATTSRTHTFKVYAIDNSLNPSTIPATVLLSVIVEPPNVTGFTAVPQETDRSQLILNWSAVSAQDLSYYEIRQGNDGWDTAEVIATQLKSTRYVHQLKAEGYQTYMVKAYAVGGHASAVAASASLQVTLRPSSPTNLVAVQEPRDRSMVKVTWSASPGKDIDGYELRYGDTGWDNGTTINTATDAQYWWYVPSSGTYNIMIKAKTVAGYYSNVANVSITAMIEPYDVTGFTATQSMSDRTKVTLMWDMPISLDVDYFVIKKGVSWDAGTVVGQRVTGTFYDVIVTEETEQTFWIKAVSMAGKEGLNPAMIASIFNMNPSPVSNITLQQDQNDRSILNISWEATPESDLANYEIRVGYVWEDATVIGKTKELRWTYSPPETGDVKIMIKTVNAAGYPSDEASANLYCTLEPGNVTGFRVFQNGEKLAFVWSPVGENDVVGYELREGGSFDNGTIVATGITLTQYQLAVDTEILRKFHIKAVNRSGHYSNSPASVSIVIADLPPKNVIQIYDEIALQSGTHSGTEFGESLITFATLGGTFADYPTTKFSDIGGAMVLKLAQIGGVYQTNGTYLCDCKNLGQIITANIATVFQPSILYTAGTTVSLEYRTSRDEITWTDWQPFSPLEATFRYADFRVNLATSDTTKTPEINELLIRVDVPDKTISKVVTVPVGGITAEYGHAFYEYPVVTATADGSKRRAERTNKTKSCIFLQVFNTDTGVDTGGTVDLIVKGY